MTCCALADLAMPEENGHELIRRAFDSLRRVQRDGDRNHADDEDGHRAFHGFDRQAHLPRVACPRWISTASDPPRRHEDTKTHLPLQATRR
jgi:hypothetical protein